MNLPNRPASYLLQWLQGAAVEIPIIEVATVALRNLVAAYIDLLIEEQLPATVWVKPGSEDWLPEIERYQQKGFTEKLYLFANQEKGIRGKQLEYPNSFAFLVPKQSLLATTAFLIVFSEKFSALIVAEQLSGRNQPVWRVGCSLESIAAATALEAIQQDLGIKDEVLADTDTNTSATDTKLVANLLLKQLQRSETSPSLLVKQKAQDEESAKVQGFIRQVAQELRTPLTHMKTALSILESSKLKLAQRQRYLEMLRRQWEHQNSLVSGLLDLMELECGSPEDSITPLALAEFIPGIVSTYQPLAMEKGIQLGYTIPPDLPEVSFPSNELRQIIINLLNNSLKFTAAKGKVSVQISLAGDYVQLAVIDTGVGISPIDLRRIFDSFYRGRVNLSEDITGAGLGLTIVQQLLQLYGGSISVASQVNKGSSFKVLLPTAKQE